jgi:hypothetical protein
VASVLVRKIETQRPRPAEPVQALQHGCADNATLQGDLRTPLGPDDVAAWTDSRDSDDFENFDADGEPVSVTSAGSKWPLCDKTIGDDGLLKLEHASANLNASGTPFFLAIGFRKPHTPWRFPFPYLQYYQAQGQIDVAEHPTLDRSVPPIAISSFDFQNPYEPMSRNDSQSNRLAYYAAVRCGQAQPTSRNRACSPKPPLLPLNDCQTQLDGLQRGSCARSSRFAGAGGKYHRGVSCRPCTCIIYMSQPDMQPCCLCGRSVA